MSDTDPAPDPFDTAEMYDCCCSEELSHTDVESAIEEYLENHMEQGTDVVKLIQEVGSITVDGYVRMEVSENERKGWARSALEGIFEAYADEYSDPNGDEYPSDENFEKSMPHMLCAIDTLLSGMRVWGCEDSGSRTYQPEEIEAMMRKHREEWFEEQKP